MGQANIFIGCAAVADYRLIEPMNTKLKKEEHGEFLTLQLVKNEDIISYVGHLDEGRPFTVGFAAETENFQKNAEDKIQRKKLDLIVVNNVADRDIGFNSNDNAASVYSPKGIVTEFGKMSKIKLADLLMELIISQYKESKHTKD